MLAPKHFSQLAPLLLAILLAAPVNGQQQQADRVLVRRANSQRSVAYSGRVMGYAGGILRLRLTVSSGTRTRQFKTDEIVSIETPQTEPHRNGLKAFEAGQYQEAVVGLEAAVRDEPRDWVRRDILALLVRIHQREGRKLQAADAFVRLTNSDPRTHHSGSIPLWWSNRPTNPAAQRQARLWVGSANRSARLIAASILFQAEETRDEALQLFKATAESGRAPLINLARAQEWRGRLLQDRPPSDAEMLAWRNRLKSMKQTERAGPWFLLGQGYAKRHEHDRAALAFLWLPFVYSEDEWLAAEASLLAAQSLQKAGRLAEAESQYRETVDRFSKTPFAFKADQVLKPQQPAVPQK